MSTIDDVRLEHFWRWGSFGKRQESLQYEFLYAHHQISNLQIATYPDGLIKHQRDWHRQEVGNLLIPAIYNGWMVRGIEWFEGEIDDLDVFRDLYHSGQVNMNDDMYHFWTRVELEAMWQQVQRKRHKGKETSFEYPLLSTYSPRPVDSKDLL